MGTEDWLQYLQKLVVQMIPVRTFARQTEAHLNNSLFKNSVRTSKKTQQFTITWINCPVLFKNSFYLFWESRETHIYRMQMTNIFTIEL
jgi:hypothetical protein